MNDSSAIDVIEVKNLKKWFPLSKGFFSEIFKKGERQYLKAVDGVSFAIKPGEVFGLAGESGCGKSTTGMTVLKLYEATSGEIVFRNQDLSAIKGREELKDFRKHAQIVFQNPYESLNPRYTVFQSVDEPVHNHYPGRAGEHYERVVQAVERAGLVPPSYFLDRYPHELSGGQLQRVAIARAISVEPVFLVADEPVSMLDVSIRAGILNLLKYFSSELNMGVLYISHDLSTMNHICTSIGIMYLGKIVELGNVRQVLKDPQHPYTQALVSAIPLMGGRFRRKRILLEGAVPSPINLPEGCRFRTRCPKVNQICGVQEPTLVTLEDTHQVACHCI
ncbi:MAG: ABC transporter ATP-binding protein [Desulfobacteraceae bacterium]|nr:ABC transporter ATP-binding protein [Desulfobacteraceae bacterium]